MQGFVQAERGSTRLAVAIAAAVIAVLGSVAVPLVIGQGHRAQDTRAQSALQRLATQIEACRVTASSYTDCDEAPELETGKSVHWGSGAGGAGVLADRSGEHAFTAYVVSTGGHRVYVWASQDAHVSRRVCSHGSVSRLERDGCSGPGW